MSVLGGVLLAIVGWWFTFGLAWGNFWLKIGITVAMVCGYSLLFERPEIKVRASSIAIGVVSAVLLYAIFFVGNAVAPYVVGHAATQVGGIYGLGTGSSLVAVFFLLLLVTGPGEEIFWRGFLQRRLEARFGRGAGYVVATLIYGGVHVFSGNVMLIGAALVAGAFWGAQYLWRRDLTALIVSHSLWSACIFAIAPIR